jgi:hypothetical protein
MNVNGQMIKTYQYQMPIHLLIFLHFYKYVFFDLVFNHFKLTFIFFSKKNAQ